MAVRPGMVVVRAPAPPAASALPFERTWLATIWLAVCIALLVAGATLPFIRSQISATTIGTSLWHYTPRLLTDNTPGMMRFLVLGLCTVLAIALGLLLGLLRLVGKVVALLLIVISSWGLMTSLFLMLVSFGAVLNGDLAPGPGSFLLTAGTLGAVLACSLPPLRRGWLRPGWF